MNYTNQLSGTNDDKDQRSTHNIVSRISQQQHRSGIHEFVGQFISSTRAELESAIKDYLSFSDHDEKALSIPVLLEMQHQTLLAETVRSVLSYRDRVPVACAVSDVSRLGNEFRRLLQNLTKFSPVVENEKIQTTFEAEYTADRCATTEETHIQSFLHNDKRYIDCGHLDRDTRSCDFYNDISEITGPTGHLSLVYHGETLIGSIKTQYGGVRSLMGLANCKNTKGEMPVIFSGIYGVNNNLRDEALDARMRGETWHKIRIPRTEALKLKPLGMLWSKLAVSEHEAEKHKYDELIHAVHRQKGSIESGNPPETEFVIT